MKILCTAPTSIPDSRRAAMKSMGVCAGAVLGTTMAWAQPDYAPAHWSPAGCTKYYTTGNGHSFCVIHDMEGYYLDSISYLNRCDLDTNGNYNVSASVYYLVNGLQNGTDNKGHAENHPNDPVAGDITQSVRESDYAWHVVCWNKYMFGTEHEGFVTTPAWYSEAMYQASAGLQRHLCNTYGIAKDRNHIIGHNEWQNAAWTSWMATNWPQINTTCNTHTDPGQYWNWTHFMALLNGTTNSGGPYWDMNGPNLGAGTAPSGTWDTTSTNWTADPNGGIYTGPWVGTSAIFSAGADATGSYTVTVVNTQTVNNLYVQYGTVTFGSGQLSFKGSGSYYSNYVAAGCSAIYNVPFVGTGSPDKWGPGTTAYNGASTSAGYFTLNEGTIAFGNDAALSASRLEVGDQTGANIVTLKSSDATAHSLANYLVLKATNFNIGPGGSLTFSGPINVNSNALPARTIAVSNSVTTFSGALTNTCGLTKTGPGTLVLGGTSANAYGSTSANGNTTVSGGTLQLSKTAGLAAVPNGTLILNAGGTLLLGAANQIGDAVPMTLGGGVFQTGGFSEQLGTLKLTANSVIDLGAGASVLKFTSSSGVGWTAATTLTITNWNGSVTGGGAEQVVFGSNNAGLTSGQVSQIRFANPPGFPAGTYAATILSTGEVVPLTAPPMITLQPVNQTAVAGNTVSFTVAATGTPAPAYQWTFNGTNLSGATATSLVLPGVTTPQAGSYFVSVTNVAGSTNSTTAVLSVYATAAPSLSGAIQLASGQFQFSLSGVPGYDYAVLGSTNLTNWTPLQTNVSPFTFTDTNDGSFPSRYYRAQLVP
jgi:autotransporter-associated beta strand protein